jgi:hypothetical protein
MTPSPLHAFSNLFLALGLVCSAVLIVDVIRHPQYMMILDFVWPVTALFGTVIII